MGRTVRWLGPAVALLAGCGARSSLDNTIASGGRPSFEEPAAGSAGAPVAECAIDVDCASDPPDRCQPVACQAGKCVDLAPVVCDDKDPCTDDSCAPGTGLCVFAPASFDLDGDGVRGPRPGTKAGDPGSCGDDCDDTSPLAFPGAKELCDGVDNDCNGVIDDSAKYLPVSTDPVLVSDPSLDKAYAGGMAYAGDKTGYLAAYTGSQDSDTSIFVRPVGASGQPGPIGPKVNGSTGDAQGGPMVWTGDRYGMAWSDRRDGDYEIYANTFGPDGAKLGPDVRVSDVPGFSVGPALAWTGTRFFVAWQDDAAGVFEIYTRVLGLDGKPQGVESLLASAEGFNVNAESPAVAATSVGLGVVYRLGTSETSSIRFVPVGADFKPGAEVTLVSGANYIEPSIAANGASQFVVVWGQKLPFRVFGTVIDVQGKTIVPPTELDATVSEPLRAAQAVGLGDRVLVAYSRQFSDGYDLFTRTFGIDLQPQSPAQQLTKRLGDDFIQSLVFGPTGDVGVLFNGKLSGDGQGLRNAAFFTRLQCDASQIKP